MVKREGVDPLRYISLKASLSCPFTLNLSCEHQALEIVKILAKVRYSQSIAALGGIFVIVVGAS